MKFTAIVAFLLLCFKLGAQEVYRTKIFDDNIKTLQINVNDDKYRIPVITLNGSDVLNFKFDEMSHNAHSYDYRVFHCNADWTKSNLTTDEYLNGYTNGNIDNYELSKTTTFLYTHYQFTLPNDEMSFKISGNYVVQIYEDNNTDHPIAQACFCIVDPKVTISAQIRGNTDTELSKRLQQLDFDVNLNGYNVNDPNSEIKVTVRQNNRTDNEVTDIQPTYISNNKLSYVNNNSLIFEGGNEYHRFDISSIYAASVGVEDIQYHRPHYDVYLVPNKIQHSRNYTHDFDVNGKFIINYQEAVDNSDIEADYMYVHVLLDAPDPFFDGLVYLGGEFNYNLLDDRSRMNYDFKNKVYYKTLLLKQGGYNYQYWFVPKGSTKGSCERIDGSYWQTGNEYTIYIYDRPWGGRYDHLIGVKSLDSNNISQDN